MRDDFFDTNILVYAASSDPWRATIAARLIDSRGAISVQSLNEFIAVARRQDGFDWRVTRHFLAGVRRLLDVRPLDIDIHDRAMTLAESHQFHIYDALIVAAALAAGARRLLTEDMQHGMTVDGRLRIVNPFAPVGP